MGGITVAAMEWWSIEVFNGRSSAARWKDAHGEALVEAALTNGAVDWAWQEHRWGGGLGSRLPGVEWRWERFYGLPAVQAALDAAPDPIKGLLVHRGRVAARAAGCRVDRARWPGLGGAGCPSRARVRRGVHRGSRARDRGGTLGPSFIGPGFHGDRPAPDPHPTPLDEPAAIAQFLAVAGPAAADQSAWRDLAEGGSGGRGGGG